MISAIKMIIFKSVTVEPSNPDPCIADTPLFHWSRNQTIIHALPIYDSTSRFINPDFSEPGQPNTESAGQPQCSCSGPKVPRIKGLHCTGIMHNICHSRNYL